MCRGGGAGGGRARREYAEGGARREGEEGGRGGRARREGKKRHGMGHGMARLGLDAARPPKPDRVFPGNAPQVWNFSFHSYAPHLSPEYSLLSNHSYGDRTLTCHRVFTLHPHPPSSPSILTLHPHPPSSPSILALPPCPAAPPSSELCETCGGYPDSDQLVTADQKNVPGKIVLKLYTDTLVFYGWIGLSSPHPFHPQLLNTPPSPPYTEWSTCPSRAWSASRPSRGLQTERHRLCHEGSGYTHGEGTVLSREGSGHTHTAKAVSLAAKAVDTHTRRRQCP